MNLQCITQGFIYVVIAFVGVPLLAHGEPKPERPKPAPIPVYNPARQPVVTGEFPVGLIVVTFKETTLTTSRKRITRRSRPPAPTRCIRAISLQMAKRQWAT